MSFTTSDWMTLVAIPFVVSVVANVFTPVFQRWVVGGLSKAIRGSDVAALGLVRLRSRQLVAEISELERYRSNPYELVELLKGAVIFCQMGLWALLLSPVLALAVRKLAPYLPWVYSNPDFAFAAFIGALAGAGPFQAAIYCSVVLRKLKKIRNSDVHLSKLRAELDSLLPLLASSSDR